MVLELWEYRSDLNGTLNEQLGVGGLNPMEPNGTIGRKVFTIFLNAEQIRTYGRTEQV